MAGTSSWLREQRGSQVSGIFYYYFYFYFYFVIFLFLYFWWDFLYLYGHSFGIRLWGLELLKKLLTKNGETKQE